MQFPALLLGNIAFVKFWMNPNFIVSKHTTNLQLDSLELKILTYIYENILDNKVYHGIFNIKNELNKLPLSLGIDVLYLAEREQHRLIAEDIETFNATWSLLPDQNYFKQELTPDELKVLGVLANGLLEIANPSRRGLDREDFIKAAMTKTAIGTKTRFGTGESGGKRVILAVTALIEKGLVMELDRKRDGIVRTKAKTFYTLNWNSPISRFFIAQEQAKQNKRKNVDSNSTS